METDKTEPSALKQHIEFNNLQESHYTDRPDKYYRKETEPEYKKRIETFANASNKLVEGLVGIEGKTLSTKYLQ